MRFIMFYTLFTCCITHAQTILNSESLLNHSTNKFNSQINLSFDWESGNENTFASFNQILIGMKQERQLWRLILGHDYEDDEGEIVANDWSAQLRLNYFARGKNSIYGFIQTQNIKVLQMSHRQLVGGGYRHSLFDNDRQYIDLAAGLFYEDEEYPDHQTHKYRFNINMFIRVKLLNKLYFNCVTYFQVNTKDANDIRFFVEPKINFEQNKFALSIGAQNRYNSTPYSQNKKNDLLSRIALIINLLE